MTSNPESFFKIVDKVAMLRQFKIFSDLNEEELQDLAIATEIKTIAKHKYIFKCGDESNFLYVLINGTIKVGNTSSEGREVIKTIIHQNGAT